MGSWSQFYATIGTASAALLGLLFVAVSVNAESALGKDPMSRRLAEQAFHNYLTVMMVSLVGLFPGIQASTFGLVTLLATASWSVWVVIRFYQTVTQSREFGASTYAFRRHLASLAGFAMLLVSALLMAIKRDDAFNWIAASTLVLLFSATTVSWELLRRLSDRHPR
ncbi:MULTISPECIES: hypothetical protein [unclassified Mesorhizobium]|uniref:hypothetical protein n=1 Tax=unclassified Mesorhizobium TaxID=325217 RepID=UPI00086F2331|nr:MULTISPECIES: hypothetical protein [unclassified Mesorhizobium]MBN9256996.1 hypothetical protein [Mesorhizobium sp.]ODT12912.1 MAG: hypothetical protein ABS57_20425 [Mesorhizobium sp. SCN 65-12]OJX80216.1 MAG: hypothetical protein BGO93_02325 [Mesorhizobium sp. 65-26]